MGTQQLVIEHLGLAANIAGNMSKRLPRHLDSQDIHQDARLGLMYAAARYDARKNVPFGAYARRRIGGAVMDGLRRDDHLSRCARARARAEGAEPPAEPLPLIFPDQIPGVLEPPDHYAAAAECRHLLCAANETLPARLRVVLEAYYHRGQTMRAIGERLGISEGRVSQIHALAPHNPSVIFADEAQDLNRMQLSLVRKWGERGNYFIVAGDDDQTIYTFTGATPDAFLDPDIPDDHKIILKQSYRVPRAVHRFAESLIHQVTRRQEKEYLPRPEDGSLDRLSRDGYKRPEFAILSSAIAHLEQGKTVMFLTACAYMLKPLVAVLRKQGIPFHNPYRKSNGYWNPLRAGKRGSTVNRILALLAGHPDYGDGHHPWTHGDLAIWAEVLQSKGILRHGAKKKLSQYDIAQTATVERLDEIFEPAALESLMAAWDGSYRDLLEWWRMRLTADVGARVQFPAQVAAMRGPVGLAQTPQVMVGTIHSVKGGQADVVYLFPDLSQAGDAQYARGGSARDSVIRQFYVGSTRAREKLYICGRESALAVSL